jgi:tryptophanyl-tRNA synthetase
LGHYVGALENWLELQDSYDCHFLIADYQALGDYIDNIEQIRTSVIEVVKDWLSVGLDPQKSTFIIQSYIPEYSELTLLLSMIITLSSIERNPTLKTEISQLKKKDISLGFFNYPASQVADILLSKANLVPVGHDQLPHVELTRDIAKKFNRLYGDVFPVPQPKLGRVARLVGTDGKTKMGKSLNNAIFLSDPLDVVEKKVMKMYTDPTRLKATDPGHVENNPVFIYLDAFAQEKDISQVNDLKQRYKKGHVGDVEVKKTLFGVLKEFLTPIQEKRAYYDAHPELVAQAIIDGKQRTKQIASHTMQEVREAMKITQYEKF